MDSPGDLSHPVEPCSALVDSTAGNKSLIEGVASDALTDLGFTASCISKSGHSERPALHSRQVENTE